MNERVAQARRRLPVPRHADLEMIPLMRAGGRPAAHKLLLGRADYVDSAIWGVRSRSQGDCRVLPSLVPSCWRFATVRFRADGQSNSAVATVILLIPKQTPAHRLAGNACGGAAERPGPTRKSKTQGRQRMESVGVRQRQTMLCRRSAGPGSSSSSGRLGAINGPESRESTQGWVGRCRPVHPRLGPALGSRASRGSKRTTP
jgi:hypothetical protein